MPMGEKLLWAMLGLAAVPYVLWGVVKVWASVDRAHWEGDPDGPL